MSDGANIAGSSTTSLSISSVTGGDTGTYKIVVSNSRGSQTSNGAILTVKTLGFGTQPQSQTVTVDNKTVFTGTAAATSPYTYQWFKNGTTIGGATNSSYSINQTATGDAGSYTLTVQNSCGTAISSNAILTVPAASCATNLTNNLIAWWQFENNVNDYTTNYNGTSNDVTFITGKVGQAVKFDGTTNSVVSFGTNVGNFAYSNFTVEFWINTVSTNDEEAVIDKRPDCSGVGYWWSIRIGGGGTVGAINAEVENDSRDIFINSPTAVNDGYWHHVALVRSGVSLALYIDGSLNGSATFPEVYYLVNSGECRLGQSTCVLDGTKPYSGALDEVTFHSIALSAGDISAIYNASTAGKCHP